MSATRINRPRKGKRVTARAKKPTRASAGAQRKSKSLRRGSTRRSNSHLDFIDAAARVLDLAMEPAWKPAVAANLEATLRLAASFMDFPLPDEAEPAPIFVA
jgi:hypothetical protein